MTATLALMGLSLYLLFWEKRPEWGTWFNAIIDRLPGPLAVPAIRGHQMTQAFKAGQTAAAPVANHSPQAQT